MPEEKVYTIPLREAYKKARVRRTPYAVRFVRSFLQAHTKAETVKLGKHLNAALWARGTKKPPRSVRVRAIIDGKTVKAELFGHEYEEFKPVSVAKKEKLTDKLRARLGAKAEKAEELEKKIEGASKAAAQERSSQQGEPSAPEKKEKTATAEAKPVPVEPARPAPQKE
ncbi:MAG: 50S ribosomal protein L31e [Candidatus Aenigmatarchaeota archaeon]